MKPLQKFFLKLKETLKKYKPTFSVTQSKKFSQGAVLSEAKKESRFFFAGENLDEISLKIKRLKPHPSDEFKSFPVIFQADPI